MEKGFKGTINRNGRAKGSQNKTTKLTRQVFTQLLENNLITIQSDIDSLKPEQRLKVLIDLAGFVIPKLRSIEMTDLTDQFKPIIIQFHDHEN